MFSNQNKMYIDRFVINNYNLKLSHHVYVRKKDAQAFVSAI